MRKTFSFCSRMNASEFFFILFRLQVARGFYIVQVHVKEKHKLCLVCIQRMIFVSDPAFNYRSFLCQANARKSNFAFKINIIHLVPSS